MSFSGSANINYRAPENSPGSCPSFYRWRNWRLEKTARQICPASFTLLVGNYLSNSSPLISSKIQDAVIFCHLYLNSRLVRYCVCFFFFWALNCGIVYPPHFIGITLLLCVNFLPAPSPSRTWSALLNSTRPVPSFRLTVGAEGLKHSTF